jgi:two-component system sensor histidine kinase KdpD
MRSGSRGASLVAGNAGRQVAIGIMVIGAACAVSMAAHPAIGNIAATLTLVVGVLIVGASQGLLSGLVAATIAFLFFNFFMAEPIMSLRVSGGADLAPFVAFTVTAVIAGVLAGKLKDRAAAAEQATTLSNLLLEAGNEVQAAIGRADIEERLRSKAKDRLGLAIEFHLPDGAGKMPPGSPRTVAEAWEDKSDKVTAELIAMLMQGIGGPIGILAAAPEGGAHHSFLASYANLAAIAIERSILSEKMGEVRALERSEELKSALLSSVSHDLRSPLSVISASASSLRDYGTQIPPHVRETFLRTILSECGRLDTYTANLLQLSKLESGTQLPTQVVEVNDVVVSVVNRILGTSFRGRAHLSVPIGLLVKVNPTLFELALSNIVANALAFSPPDSSIAISGERLESSIVIEVRDEGIGIPPAEVTEVFEKFHRASNASAISSGSGLGLAIARGFVEASDGSIWAEVPGIGPKGTTIGMRLPAIAMADINGEA